MVFHFSHIKGYNACHMYQINFMVSSITMYNMWCLLWCIILKLQFHIRLWHILHKPVLFNGFTFTLDECNPIIPKRKVNLSSKGTNDMVDGMNVGKGFSLHESSSCWQIHPFQFISYGWGLLHHYLIHCHDLIHQAIFKWHLHQYKICSLDHIQLWISGMPWEASFFSIKNNVTQRFLWGTNGPMILSSGIATFQPL